MVGYSERDILSLISIYIDKATITLRYSKDSDNKQLTF